MWSANLNDWKSDKMGDSTEAGAGAGETRGVDLGDAAEDEGLTQMRRGSDIAAVAAAGCVQTESSTNSVGDARIEIG